MKTVLCVTLMFVCLVAAAAQRPTELYGHIRNSDNSPARGVVVSIGNLNVTSDNDGNYRLTFVKPGTNVVSLTPARKATRSFRVAVGSAPTQQDFTIDW
jgi:hypothetical protein